MDFDTEDEARANVQEAVDKYLLANPDLRIPGVPETDNREYLLAGENRLVDLLVRSRFLEDKNIDWRSFPDHTGHSDGPGCFRCHNGQLQTAQGIPIPVNCTTCHSIPVVSTDGQVPASLSLWNHLSTILTRRSSQSTWTWRMIPARIAMARSNTGTMTKAIVRIQAATPLIGNTSTSTH